jgi:acetylglutamate kinase
VIEELDQKRARRLMEAGVIEGGMIPKVEACLHAAAAGTRAVIVDGRQEHALLALIEGGSAGTTVGASE